MNNLKKKVGCIIGVFSLAATMTVLASGEISVVVNRDKVVFTDAQPIIYEERTLIPVRAVFEKLDWFVDWDSANNMAVILNDEKVIFVPINNKTMEVYDVNSDTQEYVTLEVPAMIVDGSTMVPLRAICETLGADVNWDGNTQTVYIDN